MNIKAVEILLSDARGIYIPKNFVEDFNLEQWHLDPDSWEVQTCQDPDNLLYWDAWNEILCKAYYEKDGNTWELYQDGDLFALCSARMTDEEKINMGFQR